MTANAAAPALMSDAVARVEHARAMSRRQRRVASWGYGALFLALVLLSAWASDFSPAALAAGLPRIGEYFALILPDLRADRLFADSETEGSLAYWMYRLDEWAWLLFETANMAAMATLGATGACRSCSPFRRRAPSRPRRGSRPPCGACSRSAAPCPRSSSR
ncbi:MAG: hypothetical protein RML45_14225 [Acetobacteraceae bacterium]|nr:hypothetical protein [Acetobacteraceae bacterium]